MTERKVILYIAASLDGYIAGPDDDLSFLDPMRAEGEDYGYHQFIESVDTIIVGRKTYDWVINQVGDFGHTDKNVFVITRKALPNPGNITYYSGNLKELISGLKKQKGKHIFCDGGAEIVREMLKSDLIDEFIISLIPVLIGGGTSLFKGGIPGSKLSLISSKQFKSGLLQLHYKRQN